MRVRLVPAISLVALMLGSGCGSDDSSDSKASVPLAELPAKFADAACAALDECYGVDAELLLSGESCVTNVTDQLEDGLTTMQQGIDAGTVKYAGDAIQACLDQVRAAGCGFTNALASDVCRAALDGTIELGENCASELECAGDAYCKSGAACPGVCTAREAVGATCESDGDCQVGLACAEATGRCYELAGAGDLCGGTDAIECGTGLFCIGQDEQAGQPGNCRALSEVLTAGAGASCSFTEGPLCAPGSSCALQSFDGTTATMTCSAEVASGAACKIAFPDMCPDGEFCDVPQNTLDGTCKPLPAAGQACATGPFDDVPSICAPYTRCEAGTCRARQELGGTCQEDAVCLSETCIGGQCAPDGACG